MGIMHYIEQAFWRYVFAPMFYLALFALGIWMLTMFDGWYWGKL